MTIDFTTRVKPTCHKQECKYCHCGMEKGELQTIRTEKDWGYSRTFTTLTYFHPKCAMKFFIFYPTFENHFRHQLKKTLNARNFLLYFESGTWTRFNAYYITAPFEALESLKLSKQGRRKLIKEIFLEHVFDKVMLPVH